VHVARIGDMRKQFYLDDLKGRDNSGATCVDARIANIVCVCVCVCGLDSSGLSLVPVAGCGKQSDVRSLRVD
jgi:hypothetical protein